MGILELGIVAFLTVVVIAVIINEYKMEPKRDEYGYISSHSFDNQETVDLINRSTDEMIKNENRISRFRSHSRNTFITLVGGYK